MKGPCIHACQHARCCKLRAERADRALERKRADGWRGYSGWVFDVALPNRKTDIREHSAAIAPTGFGPPR